ncbi:hypothetical protein Slin15195_G002620 [Septoria linicola]|uniref:Uncharacterized protein n=1 Tax=Septoria linicola TaxID=215465 RepID=A0A9Q9AHF8_9PEZI|nr:hypothetical protein Slin15195_G002620 [Septoria linicola]
MMLETQRKILQILTEVTYSASRGGENSGNEKWRAFSAAGIKQSGHDTLSSTYIWPAFAKPIIDWPAHVQRIASSRFNLILDNIWLMQTDAAYMHEEICSRKAGVVYGGHSRVAMQKRWELLARDFAVEQHRRLSAWYRVLTAANALCDVTSLDESSPDGRVSARTIEALSMLDQQVWNAARLLSQTLEGLTPAMRAVRSRYTAYQKEGTIQHDMRPVDWDNMDPADILWTCYRKTQLFFLPNSFPDQLKEAFLKLGEVLTLGRVARHADQKFLDYLADLEALAEMLEILTYNQMSYRSRAIPHSAAAGCIEACKGIISEKAIAELRIPRQSVERLGQAMSVLYDTSWPKGEHDCAWLSKASTCRDKLSAFWNIYRKEMQTGDRAISKEMMSSDIMSLIDFDTRPEHLAGIAAERLACTAWGNSPGGATPNVTPPEHTEPMRDCGSTQAGPVVRKTTRAKILRLYPSTDPKADTAPTTINREQTSATVEPTPIKQDSLVVFARMFPTSGTAGGSVRWTQFVQAVTDAGLSATAEGGSAVTFSDGSTRVSVHRPHPEPVINPIMLRAIGKRFRKL